MGYLLALSEMQIDACGMKIVLEIGALKETLPIQSHRTKVEQVGACYSCLHAVARFHHFHPSTSYQGILLSGG